MQKRPSRFLKLFFSFAVTLCIIALSFACSLTLENEAPYSPDDRKSDITAYFTNPAGTNKKTLRGGPDQSLADAILEAKTSVDIAAQYLDLWSIRDALIEAHKKGVTVRMITESNYLNESETLELIEAGIPVLGDRREGLMHNKFVVIDRNEVWTGSMNFSVNGAYRNDNNLIRMHSTAMAENYTKEFEEMFIDDQFGPNSPKNTPHPVIKIGDSIIEVYFSPEDNTLANIIDRIHSANESIYFMAFSFTSESLTEAVIERSRNGVNVAGVFEEAQYHSNIGSEFDSLYSQNLDIRLDGNPDKMHHKVIIIDEQIIITGSYNFSNNAENYNDENTIIIHDPEIATAFLDEFQRVFLNAKEKR